MPRNLRTLPQALAEAKKRGMCAKEIEALVEKISVSWQWGDSGPAEKSSAEKVWVN